MWGKICKRMPEATREIITKKVDTRKDVTKQLLDILKDELIKNPWATLQILSNENNQPKYKIEGRYDKFANERRSENEATVGPYRKQGKFCTNMKKHEKSDERALRERSEDRRKKESYMLQLQLHGTYLKRLLGI